MKQLSTNWLVAVFFCFLQSVLHAQPAIELPMPGVIVNPNCHGFYIYTPQGYASGTQTYPLIVAMHGAGEGGNGTTDLPKLLSPGTLPYRLNDMMHPFPTSFTVGGKTFSFLVISGQFMTNPTDMDVQAIIDHAKANYRVDQNRIYLTGYSQGGGNIWYYSGINSVNATKIAAMMVVCGSVNLQLDWAQNIASANLPIWATHNNPDPTVDVNITINNISKLNNSNPPPNPLAKMTLFPMAPPGSHNAWTQTYDPAFTDNGLNIYQWMLQFQRVVSTPLPVVLSDYKAFPSGASSVTVSWTTASENNNRYFILERSADGTAFSAIDTITATNEASGHAYNYIDNSPLNGNNFYRLLQVDNDGRATYFDILKVIVSGQKQSGFHLSPNPVTSSVLLELNHPETGPLQVQLSDMQGRIIRTWRFEKQNTVWQQTIDISTLTPGNYTIQLKGTAIHEVQQLLKQ